MNKTLPLRDRKKAKQREALASAAVRLFLKKGYNSTTLEQICAECDVTVPTLLRYFGSKEDLLFATQGASLERCGKGLEHAIASRTVVSFWTDFMHSSAVTVIGSREIINVYRIIVNAPSLLAKFYAITRQYEELLERALCAEIGVEYGKDLHSNLLAHLLVAGPVEEALRAIAQGEFAVALKRVDTVMNYVLANFRRPAPAKPAGPERNKPARSAKRARS